MSNHPPTTLLVDGTGLLCVALLLRLRRHIAAAPAGSLVHVIATDPAATLDLPAWCHLTGHHYLGRLPAVDPPTYALRTAGDASPTSADNPWCKTTSSRSVG